MRIVRKEDWRVVTTMYEKSQETRQQDHPETRYEDNQVIETRIVRIVLEGIVRS